MNLSRATGLALLVVSTATLAVATPRHADPGKTQTGPDKIIYDMTVPWPFRHVNNDDADGDGVLDSKDKCPGTPAGAIVDANGCPVDKDGDGVPDGIDRCPMTPRGARVDRYGCPVDSDGDGVPDGIDQCEKTPKGATVDAHGCPSDSDGDGVADGIDQCPDTPKQYAVDKKGCPIPIGEVGQKFLDGSSVAMNIEFASGKADIASGSYADLDRVGDVLNDWPDAKVEIAGHTDSQGSAKFNQKLSEQRAEAVKKYLIDKFHHIRSGNLSTKGYGESKPVASNDTPEGRAQNRRVEFTLLNGKDLKKDVDTRRFKRRGE
jgi:OmpA-OmpF porin, OOP family